MLITSLEVTDYKRVRKVAITPASDRHVILIGGNNGQGKSSTLDALTAAFGGAKQVAADPVRHGSDEASIYVELDGGALTIDRVIAADGKTHLEVRDREGAIRQPQAMLDKLVGQRFLDPLAFLALPAKDQRAQLMKLIPDAGRIEDLDAKRARGFDRRTEIGRDLTKAEGELARLPEVTVGKAIDVAALDAEKSAIAAEQRAGDGLGNALQLAMRETSSAIELRDRARLDVLSLEKQLKEMQAMLELRVAAMPAHDARVEAALAGEKAAKQKLEDAAARWEATAARRAELDAELARASDHNRSVYAAEAQLARRKETAAAVTKLKDDRELVTKALVEIDKRKAEILAAAKLPVDGLSISDDGITLAGVPFVQASASERLRVALALAIAGSPGLNDVWIRDGALLDDESLELVAKHAETAGKRCWIERVGTKDPGAIIIQDGQVVP